MRYNHNSIKSSYCSQFLLTRNNGEVQLLLNWLTSPEGSTLASSSHLEKQMETLTAQRDIKPI